MNQRICIVTCDIVGPILNGGIGTALLAFADLMVECGADVTVLYPSNHSETQPITAHMETFRERGIKLESLFAGETGKELSHLVYQWLRKQQPFDAIHYHDWQGIGYWTAVAKHQGLSFEKTTLVCQVHGQTYWHLHHSGQFLSETRQLEMDFLERRSVELADVAFSPSHYMLEWMQSRGWKVPARTFVTPNLLPKGVTLASEEGVLGQRRKIDEIVFFGRLETRKGLELFCDAIDSLAGDILKNVSVTFLGKLGEASGVDAKRYIARRAQAWQFRHRLITDFDTFAANTYLKGKGRLAVICSTIENSPYTVLECIAGGVPFVAADVGGIAELVDERDMDAAMFSRTSRALRDKLDEAVRLGAVVCRPRIGIEENRGIWRRWHAEIGSYAAVSRPAVLNPAPLVSVCMSTFSRPDICLMAVESIDRQTYPNIEVVLVDDGSPTKSQEALRSLVGPLFERRGWTLVLSEEERWTGASRNFAASMARGDYILLMDDDNVAFPEEIETFVGAALATGADVLTCQQQPFAGTGQPPPFKAELPIDWMPIGPNLAQAVYENCLGDLNMLVKKEAWDALGGFTEERCGCEDVEFLAKAVLGGYRLECLPEILFYYRISAMALAKRYDQISLYRSFQRALRPFLQAVPSELGMALMLANNQQRHRERTEGSGYWKRD